MSRADDSAASGELTVGCSTGQARPFLLFGVGWLLVFGVITAWQHEYQEKTTGGYCTWSHHWGYPVWLDVSGTDVLTPGLKLAPGQAPVYWSWDGHYLFAAVCMAGLPLVLGLLIAVAHAPRWRPLRKQTILWLTLLVNSLAVQNQVALFDTYDMYGWPLPGYDLSWQSQSGGGSDWSPAYINLGVAIVLIFAIGSLSELFCAKWLRNRPNNAGKALPGWLGLLIALQWLAALLCIPSATLVSMLDWRDPAGTLDWLAVHGWEWTSATLVGGMVTWCGRYWWRSPLAHPLEPLETWAESTGNWDEAKNRIG